MQPTPQYTWPNIHLATLWLPNDNRYAIIILMTRKDCGSAKLVQEEKRIIEGLQYSNKFLIDANEELKKVIRTKSEFMTGMSHELRTPLNVIIGFAELMLDEVPGKINEEQRQGLNDILNSGKRLLELANNILERYEIDLSKVE